MKRCLQILAVVAIALLWASDAQALRMPTPLGAAIRDTDVVVTGTVTKADRSTFTLQVDGVLFGDYAGEDDLSLTTPYQGCYSTAGIVEGFPYVVCLDRNENGGYCIAGNDVVSVYPLPGARYPDSVPEFARLKTMPFALGALVAALRERSEMREAVITYLQGMPDQTAERVRAMKEELPDGVRGYADRSRAHGAFCGQVLSDAADYLFAISRGLRDGDKKWIRPYIWNAFHK